MNWNILKKAIIGLIVSCVLVTSMPSFSIRSNAAEAVIANSVAELYYLYIASYLGAHGYSSPVVVDEGAVGTYREAQFGKFVNSFLNKIKLANATQFSLYKMALERAANSGVLSLTSETDEFLKDYLESITVNNQLVLGQSTERFEALPANEAVTLDFDFVQVSNPNTVYNYSFSFSAPYETFPILNLNYNGSYLSGFQLILVPKNSSDFTGIGGLTFTDINTNPGGYRAGSLSSGSTTLTSGNTSIRCGYVGFTFNSSDNYQPSSFNFPSILTTVAATTSALYAIASYFQLNGYYDNAVDFVSNVIYDTTNTDVLSAASEVDPYTGTVTPGFTYYMKDLSLFQQLISQFNQGILSWNSFIKSLGLSSVSSSATVEQKQQAMDKVAYPDSTYDWLASTSWGDSITQSITKSVSETHSEEDTLADEAAGSLSNGQDPNDEQKEKSRGKGLLTALLIGLGIWSTPLLTSDDPTAGGTPGQTNDHPEYLPESISGINVASSLIDDIFDSAGGSNGYGLIYTIGASFVIFSVIIGASNYFGALFHGSDSKQNIKSSEKRSKGHKTNWNSNW